MPASLENRPRLAPWLIAVFRAAPKPPPMMAWGWKAYWKIMAMVAGRYWIRAISTTRPPSRKMAAMTGTIFSVTEARRCTPPRKMMAQMTTSTMPTTQDGTPKAVWNVEPMELDWTMQPMKPRARVMATAKKPARNLPKAPWKAVVM